MKPKYTIDAIYIKDFGNDVPDYAIINLNGMSSMRVDFKLPEKGKKQLLELVNTHIENKINEFVLKTLEE